MEKKNEGVGERGHTLTGSGAVSAGAEVEDPSAGADPEEREAFVACPFSKASLNRLASGISVFSFVIPILPLDVKNGYVEAGRMGDRGRKRRYSLLRSS